MNTFLVFIGILSLVLLPFLTHIFIVPKLKDKNHRDTYPYYALLPGVLILVFAAYLKENQPLVLSQSCGIVQFYKIYKMKHGQFERITIHFDDSKYYRHLRFVETLARKQKGEHVCFELYDKFKNKDIGESKIIRWIEPQVLK